MKRTSKKSVGARIRHARKAAGLTQVELAERLGTSQATVSDWETGACLPVSLDRVTDLAKVLDVDPAWIAGWSE